MGSVHNVHALYIPYCFSRSFVMPAGLRGLDGCYRNNNFSVLSLPWANTKQLHLPVTETIISSMYFLINFTAVVIIVLKREKKNKAMLSARSSTPL